MGSAGFIGSRLVEALLDRADIETVMGIDALTDYYDPAIKRARVQRLVGRDGFQFVGEDLLTTDLASLLDGIGLIFHLAGQAGVRASWGNDFAVYTERNVLATQRLLEYCRLTGAARIVYASSSSVYGNADRYPTTEKTLPRPFSPYGVTKLAGEHLCSLYAENYGVSVASLRYFTVYGPGQRPDMAFARFIERAQRREPITVHGDGNQIRDFTFVDDVVDANIAAGFNRSMPNGQVLNVCGGSEATVNDVLRELEVQAGTRLDVIHTSEKAGDVRRTGGSAALAREVMGWSPKVDLATGIRLQWHAAAGPELDPRL